MGGQWWCTLCTISAVNGKTHGRERRCEKTILNAKDNELQWSQHNGKIDEPIGHKPRLLTSSFQQENRGNRSTLESLRLLQHSSLVPQSTEAKRLQEQLGHRHSHIILKEYEPLFNQEAADRTTKPRAFQEARVFLGNEPASSATPTHIW